MTDEQFKAIRGFLTIVILLGALARILLARAWEYLLTHPSDPRALRKKRPS